MNTQFLRGWKDTIKLIWTPLVFWETGGDDPIPKNWIKGSWQEHPGCDPMGDTSPAPQSGRIYAP